MSETKTRWVLEFIDKITSPMDGVQGSTDKAKESVDKLGSSLKDVSAIDLHAIGQSVGQLNGLAHSGSR